MKLLSHALWLGFIFAFCATVQAAPSTWLLPAGSSYQDYAAASDMATLVGPELENEREKLGYTLALHQGHGARLQREIAQGYATLELGNAQTTLRVPLGWFAVGAKDEPQTLVFSPDKKIQIIVRTEFNADVFETTFDNSNTLDQAEIERIEQSRRILYEATKRRLQKCGLEIHGLVRTVWQNGDFEVRAPDATDEKGQKFSYIERFTRRGTRAERAAERAKVKAKQSAVPLPYPLSISLLAPADKFEHYLPLFGMMVRDADIHYHHQQTLTLAEFRELSPLAKRAVQLADETVAQLKAGRIDSYVSQAVSRDTIEIVLGPDATKAQIAQYRTEVATNTRERIIPFLKQFPATPVRISVLYVYDHDPINPYFQAMITHEHLEGEHHSAYEVMILQQEANRNLFVNSVEPVTILNPD